MKKAPVAVIPNRTSCRKLGQRAFILSGACIAFTLLISVLYDLEYFGFTHVTGSKGLRKGPPIAPRTLTLYDPPTKETWIERRQYNASIGPPSLRRAAVLAAPGITKAPPPQQPPQPPQSPSGSSTAVPSTLADRLRSIYPGVASDPRNAGVFAAYEYKRGSREELPVEKEQEPATTKIPVAVAIEKAPATEAAAVVGALGTESPVPDPEITQEKVPQHQVAASATSTPQAASPLMYPSSPWAAMSAVLYARHTVAGWRPEILGGGKAQAPPPAAPAKLAKLAKPAEPGKPVQTVAGWRPGIIGGEKAQAPPPAAPAKPSKPAKPAEPGKPVDTAGDRTLLETPRSGAQAKIAIRANHVDTAPPPPQAAALPLIGLGDNEQKPWRRTWHEGGEVKGESAVSSVTEASRKEPEAPTAAPPVPKEPEPRAASTVVAVSGSEATAGANKVPTLHHVQGILEEQSIKQYGPPPVCPDGRIIPGTGKNAWIKPRHKQSARECDKSPFDNINQKVVREECVVSPGPEHGHADPRCYIKSKFRFVMRPAAIAAPSTATGSKNVAITIMGELQRIDRSSTIASHVVAPYSQSGHRVTVFLTLQTKRASVPSEWHPERFKNLPQFDDAEEVAYARRLAQLFLDAGAQQVFFHGYGLEYLPLLMPTKGGGDGNNLRFRSSQTSYTLHCLTRSAVLHDMLRYEVVASGNGAEILRREHQLSQLSGPDPGLFDVVLEIRGDAYWAETIPPLESLSLAKVHVKQCLAWKGVNDKFAVIPRKFAVPWMDLLGAYYNDTLFGMGGYWNSEEMSFKLSKLFNIPIERHKDAFATMDYNYWSDANMTRFAGKTQPPGPSYGCFPKLYYHASCFKPNLKVHFQAHICPDECKKFRGKCIDGSDGLGGVPEMMHKLGKSNPLNAKAARAAGKG